MLFKAIVERSFKAARLRHERISAEIGDYGEWRGIPALTFGHPNCVGNVRATTGCRIQTDGGTSSLHLRRCHERVL